MDRAELESMLADGLSLAEIGRRVGRHESTIAYWLTKHGLRASGHDRHAPKGVVDRDELADLVASGLSSSQIASVVGRTPTTVRHWLREHGLRTQWAERRQASSEGRRELTLRCTRHGLTTFRLRRNGGYRCTRCNSEAVSRRRRRIKQTLVVEAGGECRLCGYKACVAALEFHHFERTDKLFSLSHRGVTRSIARARQEASKCVLLCANCHAEVEPGVAEIMPPDGPAVQCRDPTA